MTKYYIEMKETRRNMMSDALLSLYRKKGPELHWFESKEAGQVGFKVKRILKEGGSNEG